MQLFLFVGTLYVVDKWKEDNVNTAKAAGIVTSYGDEDSANISGAGIVKIDEANALSAPTREQLETIINAMSDEQAKQNLLGVIDDLMYIQEHNKVNAIFAIALIRKESSGGIRLGFN